MLRSFFKKHTKLKSVILFFVYFPAFLRFYFCFPIQAFFRLIYSFIDKNYMNNLKALKNAYSGKSCFIVATGPSLTIEDLETLKEKCAITFGLNAVYKIYDKVFWRPDFYVCADVTRVQQLFEEDGNSCLEKKAKKISFTDIALASNDFTGDVIYLPINRQLHGMKTFLDNHFKFSLNPIYACYDYYSVTALAMLLAAYMGFKNIYLLGCDCNYMGKLRHAKGLSTNEDFEASDDYFLYTATQMEKGYAYINQKLLKHGITTYNTTRGGNLEVFPRVNFDEIFN